MDDAGSSARPQSAPVPHQNPEPAKKGSKKDANKIKKAQKRRLQPRPTGDEEDGVDDDDGKEIGPGSRAKFKGKRLEYLQAFVPEYLANKARGGRHRRGSGKSLWDTVFPGYWTAFPWRLPEDEEPPEDQDELKKLALPGDDKEKAEEDWIKAETQKVRVLCPEVASARMTMEQRIRWWFGRQKGEESAPNPWKKILGQLKAPGAAPRRPTDTQYYMGRAEFKPKVEVVFLEAGGAEVHGDEKLALRLKVAGKLFEKEPDDVKTRVHDGAEQQHAADIKEHEQLKAGLDAGAPEDVAEARKRIPQVVQPLIDLIARYTHTRISLFYGDVDNETEVVVQSIHSRDTDGIGDFAQLAPQAYRESIALYTRYIAKAYCREKGLLQLENPSTEVAAIKSATGSATTSGSATATGSATASTNGTASKNGTASDATAMRTTNDGEEKSDTEDEDEEMPDADDSDGVFVRFLNPPGPLLRAKLMAMPEEEREYQIGLIWFNSAYENQREENMIRNANLLASLNIPSATWAGSSLKRKASRSTGSKKKRAKRHGASDGEESGSDKPVAPAPTRKTRSQNAQDDASNNSNPDLSTNPESTNPEAPAGSAKRSGNGPKQPKKLVTSDGAWARNAKDKYLNLAFEDASWDALVAKWMEWEKICGRTATKPRKGPKKSVGGSAAVDAGPRRSSTRANLLENGVAGGNTSARHEAANRAKTG
uniref:Uncharacterized protein n=1 Tax=Mycena chlorophos TaxID=658473 RepID=A0ABQ0KVV3_MYCCL|nr:predicted protein [Mycena chlorophos]